MKEIVTIQVGQFANFVGSHFWNFQDELLGLVDDPQSDPVFKNQHINMDILYRYGETNQGITTYTPRVLSIGFQGSLGTMSSRGTLYGGESNVATSVSTWGGNVSTQITEPRKKNLFLQSLYDDGSVGNGNGSGADCTNQENADSDIVNSLENSVEYWTDFSKVHYHHKSLYELNGLLTDAQEIDHYGSSRDAYSGDREEEINERLRFFIEECDHIQGIQFLVDDSGSLSGLSADFLEHIADEYANIPVLLYRVRGNTSYNQSLSLKKVVSGSLQDSISFARLSQFCKLVVPVEVPTSITGKASSYLQVNNDKPYHTSAVCAAALHTMSLPFRFEEQGPSANSPYLSGAMDVSGMIQMLAYQGRQNMIATMDVSMPVSSINGKQSFLQNWLCLTPQVDEDNEDMYALEHTSIHGVRSTGDGYALASEVENAVNSYYENASRTPLFSHISVSQCPLPIPLPFPCIFTNRVGQYGNLLDIPNTPIPNSSSRGSLEVTSIPMAARLRSTSGVLPFLESKLASLKRYGLGQSGVGSEVVRSWGFGREELEEMGESFVKMIGALKPSCCQTSSDSD